jgi:hypothetical protein
VLIFLFQYKVHTLQLIVEHNIHKCPPPLCWHTLALLTKFSMPFPHNCDSVSPMTRRISALSSGIVCGLLA